MKVLVDNFAVLAIESCLLKMLEQIFSPETVMRLPDETVRDIAAESEDSQAERGRLEAKLTSLEGGLQILQILARHRIRGSLLTCVLG